MPSKPGLGPNIFFVPTLPVKLGRRGVYVPVVFEREYVGADAVDVPVVVGLSGLVVFPVGAELNDLAEYDLVGLRGRAVGRSTGADRVG